MDIRRTRDQLFQIVSSSEYKFYMRILETGLTVSYLGILGQDWANIGPTLAQNSQKHTIGSTESVRTILSFHLKSRVLFLM